MLCACVVVNIFITNSCQNHKDAIKRLILTDKSLLKSEQKLNIFHLDICHCNKIG